MVVDEERATFTVGPGGSTLSFPKGDSFRLQPGMGKMARLGFLTAKLAPNAALMLMGRFSNDTLLDMDAVPMYLDDDEPNNGVLMLTAGATSHVGMGKPSFSERELWQLLHARRMHCSNAQLIASHDPKLSVGHSFAKISRKTIMEACKEGCSTCNAMFAQPTPRNKALSSKPPPELPAAMMDSFGPVRTPSVYFGYLSANTIVHVQSGWPSVTGAKAIPTTELVACANHFRAAIRPYVGELAIIRTDSIRQTTTAREWKKYVLADNPLISEHSSPYKHHMLGFLERIHKEAWPRVMAALSQARRGLKWWYECFRQRIF